jgi:2-dehydropantoate 2-reductase
MSMEAVHSTRVAVVGPGAIGCVCAAALQSAGRPVPRLCGRRSIAGPIVVESIGRRPVTLDATVLTDPSDAPPADIVLLAVKAHQTRAAKSWLAALCLPSTIVAVLQNGVEHVERTAPLVGSAGILPVVVHCSAQAVEPARVIARSPMHLQVPACAAARQLTDLFRGTAVTVESVHDFITAQWKKLCLNAVAGLMAASGKTSEIYRIDSLANLAHRLAIECIRVGRAQGASLDDTLADELLSHFKNLPRGTGTSILTDRLACRPLEWDARNGVIQRLGARHQIPTPISDVLVPLLASGGCCGA